MAKNKNNNKAASAAAIPKNKLISEADEPVKNEEKYMRVQADPSTKVSALYFDIFLLSE